MSFAALMEAYVTSRLCQSLTDLRIAQKISTHPAVVSNLKRQAKDENYSKGVF